MIHLLIGTFIVGCWAIAPRLGIHALRVLLVAYALGLAPPTMN